MVVEPAGQYTESQCAATSGSPEYPLGSENLQGTM